MIWLSTTLWIYTQIHPQILGIIVMSIAKKGKKPDESTILSLTVDMTVFIEQVRKLLSVILKYALAYFN